MRWFGKSWHAPVNEDTEAAPTPVGVVCSYHECGDLILAGDDGFLIPYVTATVEDEDNVVLIGFQPHLAYHRDCLGRSIFGYGGRADYAPDYAPR